MLDRRELIVNSDYQRGSAIWPLGPSSYFIDTILSGFPFPKIYMFEYLNRETRSAKREIVDGQQRISTISRFYNNEFTLGSESSYPGKFFNQLPEDIQEKFLTYTVAVDVIRDATRSEILEMFRRMNAYTLPLNAAEKRHSSFQGQFKWFVNQLSDEMNEFFMEYGVLTSRQIVRMADAAMITEIAYAVKYGVVSSSPTDLNKFYKANDVNFDEEDEIRFKILETTDFITGNLSSLRKTFMMKPYALHSLFTALIHARFGIASIEREWRAQPIGVFALNISKSEKDIFELSLAHEAKELDGPNGTYVWGCMSTTDRKARRTARVASILRSLGVRVPVDVDATLT